LGGWIESRRCGGSIVTIASTQGYRRTDRSFPYSAAKGGQLALTRNLAVEYAPQYHSKGTEVW
jgi:NAD(P)-dependent dehydrogenase (short-subunit alcohol dehydrogenase family)